MRKSLFFLTFILLGISSQMVGQNNLPTSSTAPALATAIKLPTTYNTSSNQVFQFNRVYTPLKPIQDGSLVNLSAPVEDVSIITAYDDSYGRPMQTVNRQATPSKKDLVMPFYYDEFGNTKANYLPFAAQSGNYNDGSLKLDAFIQDSTFYKNTFPDEQINYGRSFYDGSPLNLPTKNTAPGNSWTGAGVGISFSHRANTAAENVRLWTINITNEDDVPVTTTTYQPGSLLVSEVTDEKGIKKVMYTDALGRVILTKTQIAASPATDHAGWLCTYNVYDEMNHLRMVIVPKAVDALDNPTANWNLAANPTINTNLCYSYFYDNRGRVTMKRIPGKGKMYLAYDLLDRVVMSQDPNLRASNQWAYIIYDEQNRITKTGLITTTLIKDSVIAQAARSNSYPQLNGSFNVTTELYYDDYTWIAATGAPVSSNLVTTNINSTNFITSINASPDYAQPVTVSNRIRGKVTGIKQLVVNSSNYLYNVKLYDDHGRIIQSSSTNYSNGIDVSTLQYSFSGRVLRRLLQHQKAGTNAQNHTLLTKYTYDHAGRLKTVTKNLDNTTEKVISQYTYNELGQIQTKTIGGLETQNYAYNIRGWLQSINNGYVTSSGNNGNYFGESLSYDYGFTNSQLNGNIAGIKWKAAGDGITRAYGFGYDNANRLLAADFSQQNNGSTSWTNDKVDFSVSNLSYDASGNILSLKQRGLKLGNSATIDSLTYQYFTNSNQLQKVTDGITDNNLPGDFKDTTLPGDDYTYDANGNTNKDYNRHMHSGSNGPGIVYNFLDKPDSISINGKAGIYYYYDASGTQLRKQINDYTVSPALVKNYLYIHGFVYLNDTLQYVLQEEGSIRNARKVNSQTGAVYYAYEYNYFIKDHLGNVRTVLTEGKDTATYAATMESRDSAVVSALFNNVYTPVNTVYAKPTAFDTDTSNHYVSRLIGTTGLNLKTGPSLVLKVMAGDQIQINTFSFYNSVVQPPPAGVNLLSDILTSLSGSIVSKSGGKLLVGDATNISNALTPGVTQFLNNDRGYDSTRPKAYLNWILFDNQFNYVANNSGVQQVQPGSNKQALFASLNAISKNGYLYVYVSNESDQNVYFDDLIVKHYSGPLMQEQSYYPFGSSMAGISDKAILKDNVPYKANGATELEEDFGLDYYNTKYRKYDPQIGRFTGIDMLSEQNSSLNPYQFGANNPISFVDVLGLLNELPGAHSAPPGTSSYREEAFGSSGDYGFFSDDSQVSGVGDGGGSEFGSGPYASYYEGIWNSVPDGTNQYYTTSQELLSGPVQYSYVNETASFITNEYHGDHPFTEGEYYSYLGPVKYGELPMAEMPDILIHPGEREESWTTDINIANGGISTGWGAKENLLDLAAKSNPAIEELQYTKVVHGVSKGLFALQVVTSSIQVADAWRHSDMDWRNNDGNKWGVTGKAALDVTMAAIGTFGGPIGWAISGTYFIADAAGLLGHWGEAEE